MAYQLGYDVAVVSMYDHSFKLLHVVCEIRNENQSLVMDPTNHKLWGNMTVEEFIEKNPEQHAELHKKSLKECEYVLYSLPAESMDFKLYNQELHKELSKFKIKEIPKFGETPVTRIEHYISKYGNKKRKSRFAYWNFPFKSLKSSKEFPERWHSLDFNNKNLKKN